MMTWIADVSDYKDTTMKVNKTWELLTSLTSLMMGIE
jgi:hypothetical protein